MNQSLFRSFNHHPDLIFSPGVAHEDPPLAPQFFLGRSDRGLVTRQGLKGWLGANLFIHKGLWHRRERLQSRERLAGAGQELSEDQRGMDSVAGGVNGKVDDVPPPLPPE